MSRYLYQTTIDGTAFLESYESGDVYYDFTFGLDGYTYIVDPDVKYLLEPTTAAPGVGYTLEAWGAMPSEAFGSVLLDYIFLVDIGLSKSINLLAGDDYVSLYRTFATDIKIELGDGDDSLYVQDGSYIQLFEAGNGNDEVSNLDSATIGKADLGDGDDILFAAASSYIQFLEAGNGNDAVNIYDSATIVKADLGDGDDILFAVGSSNIQFLEAGNGYDTVHILESATIEKADLGDGDDILFAVRSSNIQFLEAGNGNDKATISDSATIEKADLGDGDDSIYFPGYYQANIELTVGRGADYVLITSLGIAKGTIDVSEDIQLNDVIDFNSYSYSGNDSVITVNGFSVENDKIFLPYSPDWVFNWAYNGVDSFLTAESRIGDYESGPLIIVTKADLREKSLSPFTLSANGLDFTEWSNSGDIYTASGTIVLGDERVGDLFRIEGTATADLQGGTIQLIGQITTLTGSDKTRDQELVGALGLTINVAAGTGSFIGDPIVNLAGIEINVNDLIFLDTGYRFGFDIEVLPEEIGIDDAVEVAVDSGFLVTQDSIELSDASLDLSGPYKLFDVIDVTAKDLAIAYDWTTDILILKGTLEGGTLFGPLGPETVTLDLSSDDNSIQIQKGKADLVGSISVEGIKFYDVPWGIDKILLGINTFDKKLFGELVVSFPFQATLPPGEDISASVSLEFLYEPTTQLNAIKLEVSTDDSSYVPIPVFPAAGVTGISGSVNNIATGDISFAGSLSLVFGPAKPIKAKFSGEVNETQLTGAVEMTFVDDVLVSYNGSATLDWSKGLFNATGVLRLLDGLVSTSQELKTNSNLDVYLSFSSAISLPGSLTQLGKDIQIAEGQVVFSFVNDDQLANDYVRLLGSLSVIGTTLNVAYAQYFDGASSFTTGIALAGAGGDMRIQQFSLLDDAKSLNDPVGFRVEPLSEWILLTSSWENAAGTNPGFTIRHPDGSLVDSSQVLPSNIAVVQDLSGERSLAVLIKSPDAGIWSLQLNEPSALGEVSYAGYTKDLPPSVAISSVNYREGDDIIDIIYSASDVDSSPVVSLFYSSEQGVADGLLIASALQTGDGQVYSWDISGLPDGDYYFYAVIEDAHNQPVYSFFLDPVIIGSGGYLFDGVEPPPPSVTDDGDAVFSIVGTAAAGQVLSSRLDGSDPDGDGPFSYLWESSSNGVTWTGIGNGSPSLLLTENEVNKQVRLTVSYVDGEGFLESVQGSVRVLASEPPQAPVLSLATDTGLSPTDRITANGTVLVDGLLQGASWQYSTDAGSTWVNGTGTNLRLSGAGPKSVIARQQDQVGNISSSSTSLDFNLDDTAGLRLSSGFAQLIYVAYYGRPADPGGVAFWNGVLGSNDVSYAPRLGDRLTGAEVNAYDRIVNDFGNSSEANNLLAGLSSQQKVDQVYQFCFNRNAELDPITGVNYWVDQLDRGNISLAQLSVEVALGAQGIDIVVFSNKIRSADSFTGAIDSPAELNAFAGESARLFGISYLDGFGETAAGPSLGNAALEQFLSGSSVFTPGFPI